MAAQNNAGGSPPPPPPPNAVPKSATVDKTTDTSVANGTGVDALGDQVHPDTQFREDDGNRTLAHPVTDPGPVVMEGSVVVKHPDRKLGQHRYSDNNDPLPILQRQSTGHDEGYGRPGEDPHKVVDMAPDLAISGAASDVYNKEQGKSLTDVAERKAGEPREEAVKSE